MCGGCVPPPTGWETFWAEASTDAVLFLELTQGCKFPCKHPCSAVAKPYREMIPESANGLLEVVHYGFRGRTANNQATPIRVALYGAGSVDSYPFRCLTQKPFQPLRVNLHPWLKPLASAVCKGVGGIVDNVLTSGLSVFWIVECASDAQDANDLAKRFPEYTHNSVVTVGQGSDWQECIAASRIPVLLRSQDGLGHVPMSEAVGLLAPMGVTPEDRPVMCGVRLVLEGAVGYNDTHNGRNVEGWDVTIRRCFNRDAPRETFRFIQYFGGAFHGAFRRVDQDRMLAWLTECRMDCATMGCFAQRWTAFVTRD